MSVAFATGVLFLLGAVTAPPSEYQVKAVFLFHFTQFVDWPRSAFADPTAPLVIGVLGEDPFGPYLDETVSGESADGRPIVVRRYSRAEEIGDVHMLYISTSESERLEDTLAWLKGRSVLTVGDGEDFAARGVMIRFRKAENRIRLRINVGELRAAGLSISSKLLRSAEIVKSGAAGAGR